MNEARPVQVRLTLPSTVVEQLRSAAEFRHQPGGIHDELVEAITKHLVDTAEAKHLVYLRQENAKLPRRERASEQTLIALAALWARRHRRAAA